MKKLIAAALIAFSSAPMAMTAMQFDREITGNLVEGGIEPTLARRIAIIAMVRDMLTLNDRICSDEAGKPEKMVQLVYETDQEHERAGGSYSRAAVKLLERKYPCK